MRQRLTSPYFSLAKPHVAWHPPLGKAEVRINLAFTQTSRLLCNKLFVEPAGVPGTGRETRHLLFRHISPSACKCLGMTNQGGQKGTWKPLSFHTWSSPQKDKSNLSYSITLAFQQFSGELVPVLVPEPCDEGYEEEALPDPGSEGFKVQLVLVLASEGRPDAASVSEGPVGSASASEGSPGAASASEGSPGHVPEEPVGRLPPRPGSEHLLSFLWGVFMELTSDSKPDFKPDSRPDSKLRGSSTLRGRPPDRGSSTRLCRPPDRGSSTLLGRPAD
ncbi:hypothetical protein ATANTOWER_030436 [Ataeniobius toweri]|uniref:Uncharacterized protein n=1 Tax=Ataeniobius toweri TaxID=208326 RepID=A0ABU7A9A7_9TELE|nr:hypothetical protein [Ataeniobius toweri]